ncbi:MAG: sialate O-acetylesterase [Paludibacter sp.]
MKRYCNLLTYRFLFLLILIVLNLKLSAQLSVPEILSSNMVLQQGQAVPVWGKALPNEPVQVLFAKQVLKTKADTAGNWKVALKPLTASSLPQTMTIKTKKSKISLENIVVGEVWLCAGQSNMQYRMKLLTQFARPIRGENLAELELKKPQNPMIRVFNKNRDNKPSAWFMADSTSLENTSAAGYFFGKDIQSRLNVPVGIITSAIGGTRIEGWTPATAYEKSAIFAPQLQTDSAKINGHEAGTFYKNMIEPLIPFAVKGFLWYQGENNCGISDRQYAEKYQVMVDCWLSVFRLPNAPFYNVLLAPHIYSDRLHKGTTRPVTAEQLPLLRAQQIKAQTLIPNTEYVSVSDLVDNLKDIHPSYKWTVGERLARVALAKTYGVDSLIWSGPRVRTVLRSDNTLIVKFDFAGKGLKTAYRRRVNWFEIAGENGVFRPAIADIRGTDKVVVYHPDIKNPVSVRFAWHETAMPNLVNSEGLPAVQFVSTVQATK